MLVENLFCENSTCLLKIFENVMNCCWTLVLVMYSNPQHLPLWPVFWLLNHKVSFKFKKVSFKFKKV